MAKFKSLNIGDTVRVVSLADTDDRCGLCSAVEDSVGSTLIITALKRRAGGSIVQLSNTWWYSPKGLEVLTPTEPVVHTTEDFKYTRVRVKDTGAGGVVVGRSRVGVVVAVLHDEAEANLHDGNNCEEGFVGVPDRIRFYTASDLEIIGGVQ